jgi:hypothetical protein
MRTTRWLGALLVLLMGCVLAGCASVPLAPVALDQAAKQFQPPPGQALLYPVCGTPTVEL